MIRGASRFAWSSGLIGALALMDCGSAARRSVAVDDPDPGPTRTPVGEPADDGEQRAGTAWIYSMSSGAKNLQSISGRNGAVRSLARHGEGRIDWMVAKGTDLAVILQVTSAATVDVAARGTEVELFCPNGASHLATGLDPGLDSLATLGVDSSTVNVIAYRKTDGVQKTTDKVALLSVPHCDSGTSLAETQVRSVAVATGPLRVLPKSDGGPALVLHTGGAVWIDAFGQTKPVAGVDPRSLADVTFIPSSGARALARMDGTRKLVLIDFELEGTDVVELPRAGAWIPTTDRGDAGLRDGSSEPDSEGRSDGDSDSAVPPSMDAASTADRNEEDVVASNDAVFALALAPSGAFAVVSQGTLLTKIELPGGLRDATARDLTKADIPVTGIGFGTGDDCAVGYTTGQRSVAVLRLTERIDARTVSVDRDIESVHLFCRPGEGSAPPNCCQGVIAVRHPPAPSAPLGRNFGFSLVDAATLATLFIPADLDVTDVKAFADGGYVLVSLSDLGRARGELRILNPFGYPFGAAQAMRIISTPSPSIALGELAQAKVGFLRQQERDGHLTFIDPPTPQTWLQSPYPLREVLGFKLADRVQRIELGKVTP